MKRLLPGGARRPKLCFRPPLGGPAPERSPKGQQWSILFKLFICSLLALPGISHADLRYSDNASPKVARWLLSAESALAEGQLISPPKDNALVYLERIFAEDPANTEAAEMLNQLIIRFTTNYDAAPAPRELARMRVLKDLSNMARDDDAIVHYARGADTPVVSDEALQSSAKDKGSVGQNHRPDTSRERVVGKHLRPELTELMDCHVSLGLAALQLGDPAQAGHHQKAAADLVAQYQLEESGLSYLSQLLKQSETPRTSYEWRRYLGQNHQPAPAREHLVGKHLRPELTELKDCHVSLGLAALQLGDLSEAGRQQRAAADLVAQYQLKKEGLSYLSQLVEQTDTPRTSYDKTASKSRGKAPRISQGEASRTSPPRQSPRVFGTF